MVDVRRSSDVGGVVRSSVAECLKRAPGSAVYVRRWPVARERDFYLASPPPRIRSLLAPSAFGRLEILDSASSSTMDDMWSFRVGTTLATADENGSPRLGKIAQRRRKRGWARWLGSARRSAAFCPESTCGHGPACTITSWGVRSTCI